MRIFHVTISREFDCTIAAESEENLDSALQEYSYEFEDWSDAKWMWVIHDPLEKVRTSKHFSLVDDEPHGPDMAVLDEEILCLNDATDRDNELMEKIRETIRQHKRKIAQNELQEKLPGIE
jgi:hypothetical protein